MSQGFLDMNVSFANKSQCFISFCFIDWNYTFLHSCRSFEKLGNSSVLPLFFRLFKLLAILVDFLFHLSHFVNLGIHNIGGWGQKLRTLKCNVVNFCFFFFFCFLKENKPMASSEIFCELKSSLIKKHIVKFVFVFINFS